MSHDQAQPVEQPPRQNKVGASKNSRNSRCQQSMSTPSTNGFIGRSDNGRFALGNKVGTGNPLNKRMCELRVALMEAIRPDDVREIIAALVKQAKRGDVVAAREVLDRTLGKPAQSDLLQRLDALEQQLIAKNK